MPYSTSFKKRILDQCRNGASVFAASKESGVLRSTICRWLAEDGAIETKDNVYSANDIKALERKVEKQAKIITILKTVPCTVHAPLKERLNALEALHSDYDIHTLCEALEVLRGTYYNHSLRNKRDNVWYKKREEEYRILIHDVFYAFDQIFGAKKIHAILQQRGHRMRKEYVARIMCDSGLCSIRNQTKSTYEFLNKKPKTSYSNNSMNQDRTVLGLVM